jgi:histidinol-phosphatase (PHP family)
MERACRRAVEQGIPEIAFTEHADFTPRRPTAGQAWQEGLVADGVLIPPPFQVAGYLQCLDSCRIRFPELVIHSGVELGEPHWQPDGVAKILSLTRFDRVLVSMHMMRDGHGAPAGVDDMYQGLDAAQVVRSYLAEVLELVTVFDHFDVLAHIDYAARYWPQHAGPHRVELFTEDYQRVLAALAAKGKALEINTRLPLPADIVRWWHELRGPAVAFASDAHRPEQVAHGFRDAAAMAEAAGFVSAGSPDDLWTRR